MGKSSLPDLSLGRWLSRGWKAYTSQLAPLIVASLILTVVSRPSLAMVFDGAPTWMWVAMAFSLLAVYPVLLIGWCTLLLKAVRGRPAGLADLFSGLSRLGPSWGTGVLVTMLTFVGNLLLVVPGILVWCAYMCALFAVEDRKLSASASLTLSATISAGHRGKIFGIWCISGVSAVVAIYFLRAGQSNLGGNGPMFYAIAVVVSLVEAVILGPWTCAANAVAYDDLVALQDTAAASES